MWSLCQRLCRAAARQSRQYRAEWANDQHSIRQHCTLYWIWLQTVLALTPHKPGNCSTVISNREFLASSQNSLPLVGRAVALQIRKHLYLISPSSAALQKVLGHMGAVAIRLTLFLWSPNIWMVSLTVKSWTCTLESAAPVISIRSSACGKNCGETKQDFQSMDLPTQPQHFPLTTNRHPIACLG